MNAFQYAAFYASRYRARYVFKIPVWDRQPNWNNIITSKDQEKDLKAFTCKKCGSTLFIAKTREFFFEGDTGIGGLGCFTCGAKGKENFVMDRDRIVEDVGDMDDYFEYERPLDFVSRAERRKLLKEAAGDEDKANQLLLERQQAEAGGDDAATTAAPSAEVVDVESSSVETAEEEQTSPEEPTDEKEDADEPASSPTAEDATETTTNGDSASESSPKSEKKPKKKKKKATPPPPPPMNDDDIFDALDMDAL